MFGTETITVRDHSYRMWNLGFCWRGIHRRHYWLEWWAWERRCECGKQLVPADGELLDFVGEWRRTIGSVALPRVPE